MLFPAMSRATLVSVLERSVVTAVAGRNTTADRQHHSSQQQPPHHSTGSHRSAGSVLSSEMAAKLVSRHQVILVMSSCHHVILSLRPSSSCQIIAENIFMRILVSSEIVETQAKHSLGEIGLLYVIEDGGLFDTFSCITILWNLVNLLYTLNICKLTSPT